MLFRSWIESSTLSLWHNCRAGTVIATSAHLLPSRPSSRSRSLSPTNRKSQPGARNPASLQDFEGVPLKRQTENRERNLGLTALSQPPARGWRSRSRRAKPRQHWGTDEKKPTDSGWFLEFWWWNTEPNPCPSMRFFRKALILRVLASIKWPFCIAKDPGWVGAGLP